MRILVTNDDGVSSAGLHDLAAALDPVGEVVVVAPTENQTAKGRSITLTETVHVDEVELPDGRAAFAVAGTPTDCVRFAMLGLIGPPPDLVMAGVNRGVNLGDDIGYSGTVAACLEGLFAGLPSVALSQQSLVGTGEWGRGGRYDYRTAVVVARGLGHRIAATGLPPGTLLNVNAPGAPPEEVRGVRATRLGRRVYRSTLELVASANGRRRYRLTEDDPTHHDEPGTDFTAIAERYVSITPLHFSLTDVPALDELETWGLEELLRA